MPIRASRGLDIVLAARDPGEHDGDAGRGQRGRGQGGKGE